MAIVIYLLQTLDSKQQPASGFSSLMVYTEKKTDTAGAIAEGVFVNGLIMVGMLFIVTTALMLLYRFRCYALIYGWLLFSVGSLLFLFGGYVGQGLLQAYGVAPASDVQLIFYPSIGVFSLLGSALVFWSDLGCAKWFGDLPMLRQAYLVLISALIAWSATKLPEWTTWGLLGAVALWDIVAVLTPQGPLRLLVEEAEARGEPIPGLVYEGYHIKLGLGDFVFYSLLVGRASLRSTSALVSCAVAVLAGLCATLALLPVMERVLPALPISIAAGIVFYFSSTLLVEPVADLAAQRSLFL